MSEVPGYWKGDAPFDRVIYRNIPEAATQKLTLQAGDIDIATEVSPDAVADLQSNPQLKVVQGVGADIFFLLMNENPALTSGTMSNPVVQNAVRYALDYDGINALGKHNEMVRMNSIIAADAYRQERVRVRLKVVQHCARPIAEQEWSNTPPKNVGQFRDVV
jgi:ABC-type transport system substrate-binding protein